MIFAELFFTFLVIGVFTFGGGYSMVALIEDEVVGHHGWMTAQEFTDVLAVSQMTPGPIGINAATYAGYTAVVNAGYGTGWGIVGSVVASVAVVLLPVVVALLAYRYLQAHRDNPVVASVMAVLKLAVVGLIAAAALSLMTVESFGVAGLNRQFIFSVIVFGSVFGLSLWRKASPILLIVAAGVAGWLCFM